MPGFLEALSLRGLVAGLLLLRELGEQVKLSERSSAMLTGSWETFGEWNEMWGVERLDIESELSNGFAREELGELEIVLSMSSSSSV